LYCTMSLCDIGRSPTSNRSQLFYCYMHVIDGSPVNNDDHFVLRCVFLSV